MTKKKDDYISKETGLTKEDAIFVPEFSIFEFEGRKAETVEIIVNGKKTFITKEDQLSKLFNRTQQTINEKINTILDSATYKNNHNSIYRYYLYIGKNGRPYTFRGFTVLGLILIASSVKETEKDLITGFNAKDYAQRLLQHIAEVYGEHITEGITFNPEKINEPVTISKAEKIFLLIRHDERNMTKKVNDFLKYLNVEYNKNSENTKSFYAKKNDLLCFAVTGKTSLEIIKERADSNKEYMGLITFKAQETPDKPLKIDINDLMTAKNFYTPKELKKYYSIEEVFIQKLSVLMDDDERITGKDLLKILCRCIEFLECGVLNYVSPFERDDVKVEMQEYLDKYKSRINKDINILEQSLVVS